MNKTQVLERIFKKKLVPVVRTRSTDEARAAIGVLSDCGISVFEITMTVPNACDLIAELRDSLPNVLLGAGTVLDRSTAKQCVEAGAQFIVSPAFDAETVKYCREADVAVMPGALTPTEVLSAWKAGADCVKVFPCDALGGPKYLRTLKTLFPQIEMMPTGGVSLETIGDFFLAGACAVGVGTDLVDFDAIRRGDYETVAAKARNYLACLPADRND